MLRVGRIAACLLASLLMTASSAVGAQATCTPHEVGRYPWAINGLMPGDLWAVVWLDVDKGGHPLRCYIGENNISGSETRSNVCRSFLSGWTAPRGTVPRDKSVNRIRRKFVLVGSRHETLMEQAKKRYFQDHPDVNPRCWDE